MIELTAGRLRVGLAPEIGGSLAYFRVERGEQGIDLLRPLDDAARQRCDPLGAAMFPMLPYANRIGGNAFTFEGRTYSFRPNLPGERYNLHGSGWQSAWTVQRSRPDEAAIALEHKDPDGPYSYFAVQELTLTPEHLRLRMRIENRGIRRMPFGLGQHPWFPRDPDVTLRFAARRFWLEAPDHLATESITIAPELDFTRGRPLPDTWRNNCYGDWAGAAEIRFPARGFGLRIEAAPPYRYLMLYCDPAKPVFCLEPQTHAVGALNRAEESPDGLVVLERGAAMEGTLTFSPFDL